MRTNTNQAAEAGLHTRASHRRAPVPPSPAVHTVTSPNLRRGGVVSNRIQNIAAQLDFQLLKFTRVNIDVLADRACMEVDDFVAAAKYLGRDVVRKAGSHWVIGRSASVTVTRTTFDARRRGVSRDGD